MKKILGLLLMPFLYIRYSFVFFVFVFFIDQKPDPDRVDVFSQFLILWGMYAVFFGFIMGNMEMMGRWTKLFARIFHIEYEIRGRWCDQMMHSHSVWSHPVLVVNGKEHNLSIAIAGGNLYEQEDNLRRKAIVYYFFS